MYYRFINYFVALIFLNSFSIKAVEMSLDKSILSDDKRIFLTQLLTIKFRYGSEELIEKINDFKKPLENISKRDMVAFIEFQKQTAPTAYQVKLRLPKNRETAQDNEFFNSFLGAAYAPKELDESLVSPMAIAEKKFPTLTTFKNTAMANSFTIRRLISYSVHYGNLNNCDYLFSQNEGTDKWHDSLSDYCDQMGLIYDESDTNLFFVLEEEDPYFFDEEIRREHLIKLYYESDFFDQQSEDNKREHLENLMNIIRKGQPLKKDIFVPIKNKPEGFIWIKPK